MVHALRELWHALRPDGLVLDLRCYAQQWPVEVQVAGQWRAAGAVDDAPYVTDDRAADAALAHIQREGWFVRERADAFEIYCYWDALDAMQCEINETWTPACVPDEVIARAQALAREGNSQARVRLHIVISRWRKLD